jgi:CRISPR-associated helicase Cas3
LPKVFGSMGFQEKVQAQVADGRSVLLVAPTGIGKTRAVCGDLRDARRKTVYAVPLRSLGAGIKQELSSDAYSRNGQRLTPVIHHGGVQESNLFSEDFIVTTYDQVVCGVPGLPLSLPLKSGHAVAGALLMSRLVLDEAHLAWGISASALSILLAIVDFRLRLGLQTILLTATLPEAVAAQLQEHFRAFNLNFIPIIVGKGELADDERLKTREQNRRVAVSLVPLTTKKNSAAEQRKELDWTPVDTTLTEGPGKRIYFANTVERLQATYDRLIRNGLNADRITVLHNRMPRTWREAAEHVVLKERFGKGSPDGNWILLTNQVAEAGLDISAPLVVSDPAPVDTLVQRAGRCARWFDNGRVEGTFLIVAPPKAQLGDVAAPYARPDFVEAALKNVPPQLSWQSELEWVNSAWGGGSQPAKKAVEDALNQTAFALNLFDRASQSHSPGAIANVFREILSIELAVHPTCDQSQLQNRLNSRQRPQTSVISLGRAARCIVEARQAGTPAQVIRYDDGDLIVAHAYRVELGDVVVVPPSVAYLHAGKGLCFGDGTEVSQPGVTLESEWVNDGSFSRTLPLEGGRRQPLLEHLQGVMRLVQKRFTEAGDYRTALKKTLTALEPGKDSESLVDAIAKIATLAAGFHDLGKADVAWQQRARAIDPGFGPQLIGRTALTHERIGHPHSPPAFRATVKACELLLGDLGTATHLIRAIALSAARHHSSLLNPAVVRLRGQVPYHFSAHPSTEKLVRAILIEAESPEAVIERAREIVSAAEAVPVESEIPLALPNDDLFPIYALVGRAILMADREDACGEELETWRAVAL